jgi:hypothetical protein
MAELALKGTPPGHPFSKGEGKRQDPQKSLKVEKKEKRELKNIHFGI